MQGSHEYLRLRQLLFAVIGVAATLSLVRLVIPTGTFRSESKGAAAARGSAPGSKTAKKYRSPIPPKGEFTPNLSRSNLSKGTIVDMNDRGDYLFLISPPEANYREYTHLYNGKEESLGRVTPDIRYFLSPNGSVVRRVAPAQMVSSPQSRIFGGAVTMAYNEIRFFRRFNDDGSVLNARFEVENKQSIYRLRRDKINTPPVILYTSVNPLMIFEKGENGEIWFRELGSSATGPDILWKMQGGKKQRIPFPEGYKEVDRVVQTGNTVAATFGHIQSKEPIRTFLQTGNRWKELPLPPGYTFSYVQRIMRDGLILGFVTDADREHFKQVAWKGDSVAILDDLPAWPRNGQLSYIVQATRKGDIYVRNVTDTTSGASEFYLLSLKQ